MNKIWMFFCLLWQFITVHSVPAFGLGFNHRKTFTFTGMYTTETGQVSKYYNDSLKIGVSFNFK